MKRYEQFSDFISRIYNWDFAPGAMTKTITFQVTDACNLCCSYCYQINKGTRRMKFETAKKFVDLIISGEKGFHEYINPEISPGLVVEFIGGEPFLEIDLIDQILEYIKIRLIELHHPWATRFRVSLCSNGVLYFDENVQRFLRRNKSIVSLNITVDGDKELHDACRVFANGKGSYDLAVAAAMDWVSKGNFMGSKITIAPENLPFLYDAITHMISLGYHEINANTVFEKGWEQSHAIMFYHELKRIADYLLDIDADMENGYFVSLFDENLFHEKDPADNQNWCGGNGAMLACDPDGYLYPCIRFMESSLGTEQAPLRIGDLENGIRGLEEYTCNMDCITCITRRSQETDECFYCPIGEGCAWCTAQNYQEMGTPNKRTTNICEMHKARALANVYFWNKYYRKHNRPVRFKNNVPDDWALKIISQDELDMLNKLNALD